MRTRRFGILAHVDVGLRDVAEGVHVISKDGRDVFGVFPDHAILTGGSGEAGLAAGYGRLAHQGFALEKIGPLLF